ncbi:hypothetical protein [Defluviimonas salinarum]|uniref:Uncharacterized protein n=1 Tax=Defluviimonas salinarum TaxID=2992147 RepID=A0ABT3JB65_9RHOB|nr:hypothetical protein [Defluviimonas salinarum]MCW3784674.1 hypothetical protein [Defluviimonas salinarum]
MENAARIALSTASGSGGDTTMGFPAWNRYAGHSSRSANASDAPGRPPDRPIEAGQFGFGSIACGLHL